MGPFKVYEYLLISDNPAFVGSKSTKNIPKEPIYKLRSHERNYDGGLMTRWFVWSEEKNSCVTDAPVRGS